MSLKSQGNRGPNLWCSGTLLAENRGVHVRPRAASRSTSLPDDRKVHVGLRVEVASITVGRRRRSAGFTLLELMVVIVLIGLLVTLGVPSIASTMRDRRTNQAAHQVALIYRQARALAMGRGAAVPPPFPPRPGPPGGIAVPQPPDPSPPG